MSATFEERIELLGYDVPAEVSRGEIVVRLYFRVLQPPGGSYKVFLHFDGMGAASMATTCPGRPLPDELLGHRPLHRR